MAPAAEAPGRARPRGPGRGAVGARGRMVPGGIGSGRAGSECGVAEQRVRSSNQRRREQGRKVRGRIPVQGRGRPGRVWFGLVGAWHADSATPQRAVWLVKHGAHAAIACDLGSLLGRLVSFFLFFETGPTGELDELGLGASPCLVE